MLIHFDTDKVGIGLPSPGSTVKLVPCGDGRYEVRAKGPNVARGYHKNPARTAEVFDDEGFYNMGDKARFHDPEDPGRGLAFAGRTADEFKLSSGVFVHGGALRENLLKALSLVEAEIDFPDEEVMVAMELESPYDILGLYWGHHVGDLAGDMTGALPPTIFLYRRPLLDEWAHGEDSLEHLVTHVLVHEVGHHFGLSDDDMDAIEAGLR
jgi:predicted Zn-dependent protease with MMP-like domain